MQAQRTAHDSATPTPLLDRLIKGLALALVLAVAGFAAYYTWDRRPTPGPLQADRMMEQAEQAVRDDPANPAARLMLGDLLLSRAKTAEAITQYQAVLEIDDQILPAHRGLGLAYLEQGQLSAAEQEFQRIIDARQGGEFSHVDKDLQEAYYYLAKVQLQQNAPDRAARSLEYALKINRIDADSWALLGTTYLAANQPEEAVKASTRAVALVPRYAEAYQTLAQAYRALGDEQGARYAEAMARYSTGAYDQALPDLQAVTQAKPDFSAAWTGLGLVYEAKADKAAAEAAFRRALTGNPTDFNALTGLRRLGAPQP